MEERISETEIQETRSKLNKVLIELKKEITGQEEVIHNVVVSLISQGHVLLEGMPGLAKTLLAKSIAKCIDLSFKRIQFTPDLLPADLIGTVVFNPKDAVFETRKGPIFTGMLLADEINRSPAKVQSALLQCMEEKIVTIGDNTFALPLPFMVMATENPIDHEGTYQLPEAQMDRFFMKINVNYPSFAEEVAVLDQHGGTTDHRQEIKCVLSREAILSICQMSDAIYVDPKLKEYIVRIIRNSRPETTEISDIKPYIKHGASPRASLSILRAARANSLLMGRNFVVPEDIRKSMFEILRHRIILTFEAIAEEISVDSLIKTIMESTELP
ncbi:MAG: MoxR family ATPase [Leptospiraceae bacterium]|nr:MoxR family ATPase [Leptospiraceae bacterium]MCP5494798.1 MoxR family ATPase [Leptospiraceae bacterium]